MNKTLTAAEAFEHMVPTLDEVMKYMTAAPVAEKEMVPLSVYVSAYFIGVAIATMQETKPELKERPLHDVTADLMQLIVDVLKKQELH